MSLNFEVINNLSTDDLQNLPKEQILKSIQIIKYGVLSDEGDTCSAFEFAFTQFTNILTLSEINELICEQILPLLKGKYDEAITCIDSCDEEFALPEDLVNVVETIFQLFLGLSESIHRKLDDADEFCLSHVELHLLNTLHFVCKILPHQVLSSHNQIKPWLDAMQTSITQVLVSTKLQVEISLNELKSCRKVLKALIVLGNQQSHRNEVKSMANTWKHLSKLAIDFRTIYCAIKQQPDSTELDNSSEDVLDWLEFCVENICKLITSNAQKVLEQAKGTRESMAAIKLTTFYLKLLENLAKEYTNEDFRGHNPFIGLYEMTMEMNNEFEDNDTKNYLMLINNGLANVFANTFNCDRFSTELLANFHDDHIRTCVEVTKLLLQSSITSNDWYLSHDDTQRNILHHLLFECIPKEMIKLYTSEELYDEVITLCALLISTVANQQADTFLEQILIQATLIDDARNTTILMDIWLLFLRFASEETRSVYCKLWLSISQNLSSMPRNPSSILIQNLIKHTLELLSEPYRSEILQELSKNDLPALTLLGSNYAENGEIPKLQQNGHQVVNKIKQTLAKLDPKSGIVTSNECIELMNALSSFQFPASSHLLRSLNDDQLTNYLTDALARSKTRVVELLLASLLRVLLWQKYLCRKNSVEIDCSDSPEVQKFFVLELISLAQLASDCTNINAIAEMDSFQNLDDLIQARIQKMLRKPRTNSSSQNELMSDLTSEYVEYFEGIFENDKQFGCTTVESCLNQNAIFKRGFEQIVQEAKKMENAWENNSQVNLAKFSDEITFLSDFFSRLKKLC